MNFLGSFVFIFRETCLEILLLQCKGVSVGKRGGDSGSVRHFCDESRCRPANPVSPGSEQKLRPGPCQLYGSPLPLSPHPLVGAL